MATLIPSRNLVLPRMTPGERRTAHRLEDKLDDDYLAWFDVPVGPRERDSVLQDPIPGSLTLKLSLPHG